MSAAERYDIIIVGAGLVGAALALALQGSGLRLAVVESLPAPGVPDDDSWDSRIYAISPGNARFLDGLGAWGAMDPARLTPIHAMQVWGDDGRSQLNFDAFEAHVPALGHIVESRQLQAALWRRLQQTPGIDLMPAARGARLAWQAHAATLTLADGRELAAPLVVGADGGASWTRAQAGLAVSVSDFRQMGVVANFAAARPHRQVARQWFAGGDILAWLPLPGNRISMVWSTDHAHARRLLALPPEALAACVAEAGQHALGELTVLTPAAAFPLRTQRVERLVMPRLALVGDAAHLVHPLAGQGVNLGFHDAACLAQVLRERPAAADVGDYALLRRYERARKRDIAAMQQVTVGLNALFQSRLPGVGELRNWGLGLTERLPWVKQRLMSHAIL